MDLRLRDVLRAWWHWTLLLAAGVSVAAIVLGTGRNLLLVGIAAVAVDVAVLRSCLRTWYVVARYRWLWWKS